MKYRSVVVQEDPARRLRLRILLILSLIGVFAAGLAIGSFGSFRTLWILSEENTEFSTEMQSQLTRLQELEQLQANSEIQGSINAQALELVRMELAEQQALISELEKGLYFYKSLMSPEDLAEGLSIRSIDVTPGVHEGHYQFRILVQQSARRHDLVDGTLKVVLVGTRGGAEELIELSKITEDVPRADIRLRFKYFQAIDGDLDIPEGFIPLRFEAQAKTKKPKKAQISMTFPWSVQENLTHVGQ